MNGWLWLAVSGVVSVVSYVGASLWNESFRRLVADRRTGEDRRRKLPVGKRTEPLYPLLETGWEGKEVEVLEGFFTLESKQQLYWCTLTPIDLKKIERVVVFFHGYTGSCAWLEFNVMATMAKLGNCAMIGVDMPGHGRSDGDHVFIDGWHPYVDCAKQFVEKFCASKLKEWSEQRGKELKLFGMGESMGGGIVMTLSIDQPSLFSGLVLHSPMIAVSKEMMPHPLITWLFKHVICALIRDTDIGYAATRWPLAPPPNDLTYKCVTDPAVVPILLSNPFGLGRTAPRLRTIYTLAFEAPDWIQPRLKELDVPCLIMHARGDTVTDPQLSEMLFAVAKTQSGAFCYYQDKTIKLYENAAHMDPFHGGPMMKELLERVYADIFEWLKQRS